MLVNTHVRDAFFELDALRRYRDLKEFTKVDWTLKKKELYKNSYRSCRSFYGKGTDEGIYGETPLQTVESMLREIGFTGDEPFIDIGCGRGRLCFFTSALFSCESIGIDLVPSMLLEATKLSTGKETFILGDYTSHLTYSGVYYWYASTLREFQKKNISKRFLKNARVITISTPLEGWELLHTMPASFIWGETTAYYQIKR